MSDPEYRRTVFIGNALTTLLWVALIAIAATAAFAGR